MIEKYIKTQCGLDRYRELRVKKGVFARIRFCWFLFFGTLRDLGKKNFRGTNESEGHISPNKSVLNNGRFCKFRRSLKNYLGLAKYKKL